MSKRQVSSGDSVFGTSPQRILGDEVDPVHLDDVYDALQSSRRRDTLRFLESFGETDISELADEISRLEFGEAYDSSQRKNVYVTLRQSNLPSLDEVSAIEFDKNRGTVKEDINSGIFYELVGETFDQPLEEISVDENNLDVDVAYHLLSNSRRRAVIRYFNNFEGSVTLGELSTHIAASELDLNPENIEKSDSKRQNVYIGLYSHGHLDKLDANDIIDYDKDSGVIEEDQNLQVLTDKVAESFYNPEQYLVPD